MSSLSHYANLRQLLAEMEHDLKISFLTEIDKKVMSTLVLLSTDKDKPVHLDDIRNHDLTNSIPSPTLYRSFQTLINNGFIQKVGSVRSGLYHIVAKDVYPSLIYLSDHLWHSHAWHFNDASIS